MDRKHHQPEDTHFPSGRSRAESAPVYDTRRGLSPALSHTSDNGCRTSILSPAPTNTLNPVSAAISALANAATCPSRNCVSPAVTTPFCQLSGLLAQTPTPPSTPRSPHRVFSRNSDVSVQSLINSRDVLISPSSVLGAPPPHHVHSHSVGPPPRSTTSSSSHSDFMDDDEIPRDIDCGSVSPVSTDSTVSTSYGSPADITIAAVVIFHNLRSLRKSPRGFLREEMDLSVQNAHELQSIKILREPEHHEFVNVFEFNVGAYDEVTAIANGEYTRYTINLNAALTKRGSSSGQKKRARTQTPISQNETVFRLNNAARGVGTPYRLEVTVSDGMMDIIHKSEIFRVFGPTSEFGRTTHQDKMNCLSNEQGLGMIRKVSRETIEEMMPEIITTVRMHLMQHKEAQRIQRNRQLEMLLRENSRLHQMMSSQLKVQIPKH